MSANSFFDLKYSKKIEPNPDELLKISEDKHTATLAAIRKYSKPKEQSGLTNLKIEYKENRKTRLCMVMLPEWDPSFVPYNLAKLSAAVKSAGFYCKCFDLNVESFYRFKRDKWNIHFNPWDSVRDWHWIGDQYYKELNKYMEPIIDEYVDILVKENPDVIGFTLYYCNLEPTKVMAKKIKEAMPNVTIVVGGPNTHYSYARGDDLFDYVINGEGEQPLLNLLNSKENNSKIEYEKSTYSESYINSPVAPKSEVMIIHKIIRQPEEERVNLNNLPIPDYSDFELEKYQFSNGGLCEISRGCIAKCTFCEETHFWKYRQRNAESVVKEIEYMYYTYGMNVFWFIDSLVNGNLNELRGFCKGIAEKGLEINWTGYCRHDGRMDIEYYRDLKNGGCRLLNYGSESASQKILDLMDKKVTVAEMEQNFKDGAEVGIGAMTNWIFGFPGEGPKEYEDTLTFLWRIRDYQLEAISCGQGFVVGVDTIVGQNFDRFDLSPFYYYDHWITKDFKASIAHKIIKAKCFSIFTDLLPTKYTCAKPYRPNLAREHYKIKFHNENTRKETLYDYADFDYQIIKPNISNFADSLVNEIWPFLRIIWRARGGYQLWLIFDIEKDKAEWGARASAPLDAEYFFEINDEGEWNADFKFNYQQETFKDWNDPLWYDPNTKEICISPTPTSPVWKAMDLWRGVSNSVIRARKLAWRGTEKESKNPYDAWDEETYKLNLIEFYKIRNLDFSFKYEWKGSGKWTF